MRLQTEPPFDELAAALREQVTEWYRARGQMLTGDAGLNTLETNSGYVERRGRPLAEICLEELGFDSLRGVRLLDLGCGFGALAVYFGALGASVIGVDPDEERLAVGREVADRYGLDVTLLRGRMERTHFDGASFDIAVQNNSLCYVVPQVARAEALAEAFRVLRPGGGLVVRNPNRWHPFDQFTRLPGLQLLPPSHATALAKCLGRARSHVRLASPLRGRREIAAAGFDPVKLVPTSRSPARRRLVWLARYQHFVGVRPPAS